jgi:hypothetical protein
MRRVAVVTVCGMWAVVPAAACTAPDGSPSTHPPARSGAATAPHVRDPLSPRPGQLRDAPCSVLPGGSADGLGMPAEASRAPLFGAPDYACQWQFTGGSRLTIAWPAKTPGLAALYARRAEQLYFEETTVLGYPAVFANEGVDRTDRGHCVLNVGVQDDLVFYAAAQTVGALDEKPTRDACTVARSAATAVVRGLSTRS